MFKKTGNSIRTIFNECNKALDQEILTHAMLSSIFFFDRSITI